jgi:hypothetical protein
MNDETYPLDEVAQRMTGWWLDVENLQWDREAAVALAPIEVPETRVRFGVGTSKAPARFRHQLVIRPVIDLEVSHDGGYPFAQPVEAVTFNPDLGEMTIKLGFGSTVQMLVRTPEVRIIALNGAT